MFSDSNEMDVKLSSMWILAYSLGNLGINGDFDIFLIRVSNDRKTIVTKKVTSNSSNITCTASINGDKLHIAWNIKYIKMIMINAY